MIAVTLLATFFALLTAVEFAHSPAGAPGLVAPRR